MTTFAKRLKRIRETRGISQAELGKLCGLTSVAISLLENNRRLPNYNTLVKIRGALDISFDTLMGGFSYSPEMSIEVAEIISNYSLLGKHDKEVVQLLVSRLASKVRHGF